MSNIVEIRLQEILYGIYKLWMGLDNDGNLYMTFSAIEGILEYRSNSAREKIESKKAENLSRSE